MKIALILPYDSAYRYQKGSFKKAMLYPPLTLTTLAGLVPEELNAEIEIYDEGSRLLDFDFDGDLVAISAVTATSKRAYYIADHFRKKGKTVILGGVHTTIFPDEAASHADAIVTGSAEVSWPQLLLDYKAGKLQKQYTIQPDLDLKGIPFPRQDILPKGQYLTTNTIMASRGCPNKCSFCSIPVIRQGRYYQRPISEVIDEMKQMKGKTTIFFDPSFTEDRDYALELMEAMIPLKRKWGGLSTIGIAKDDELLSLAQKSGCVGVLIGFESICQASLNGVEKNFNRVTDYEATIKKLHDYDLAVLACMMFGLDSDTKNVFDDTLQFVQKTKIDLMRYTVMTPFPGTKAFEKLDKEGRILSKNWEYYDYEHVVYEPKNMTPKELNDGLAYMWRETYRMKNILSKVVTEHRHLWLTLPTSLAFRNHGIALGKRAFHL